jgi:hypothetical protein
MHFVLDIILLLNILSLKDIVIISNTCKHYRNFIEILSDKFIILYRLNKYDKYNGKLTWKYIFDKIPVKCHLELSDIKYKSNGNLVIKNNSGYNFTIPFKEDQVRFHFLKEDINFVNRIFKNIKIDIIYDLKKHLFDISSFIEFPSLK